MSTHEIEAPSIEEVVARALGIAERDVTDELSYQSIPQWDSLRHVSLIVALEEAFGWTVDADTRPLLDSVRAIRELRAAGTLDRRGEGERARIPPPPPSSAAPPSSRRWAVAASAEGPVIHRGLDGVYVDRSRITKIDGEHGMLEYRGYAIHDLATRASFEQTAYLLLHGELPDRAANAAFASELAAAGAVPVPVLALMRALAHAHPMEALRTGVSALGAFDRDRGDDSPAANLRTGVRLIGQVPTLIAAHHAARRGRDFVPPPSGLTFATRLLHLLLGEAPPAWAARLMERDLIVHADHSSNPSTFAARVVVGCRASMHAAITAAISAFEGRLHGGAAEGVMAMVDEVATPDRAAGYVAGCFARKKPVMGFGHRVYRTEDPRVRHLREAALEASRERGDMRAYDVIAALVQAMKPYARHGVDANVDLYAGLFYRMVGLPDDLAVPIFVAGRMAGWVAQALEQLGNNVLIRPLLDYVGPTRRRFPSPEEA